MYVSQCESLCVCALEREAVFVSVCLANGHMGLWRHYKFVFLWGMGDCVPNSLISFGGKVFEKLSL